MLFDTFADGETVYYDIEPDNVLSVNISLINDDNEYKKFCILSMIFILCGFIFSHTF